MKPFTKNDNLNNRKNKHSPCPAFFSQHRLHCRLDDAFEIEFLYSQAEGVCNCIPISAKTSQRYIAGLSMGGYGALLHGLQNPTRYNAIGSFLEWTHREDSYKKLGKNKV